MFYSDQPNPTFLALLGDAQAACGKSDEQIALELGFSRGNVISAIKCGLAKFPVGKIMLLARVLDVSPSQLLEAFLREISPELLDAVRKVWGPTDLSSSEQKVLDAYRTLSGGREVEPLIMDGRDVIALITA